jgi:lysozyme family protein
MKSNLELIMDWVFVHEGGYAERPEEPGGAVNMGISFTAYKDAWKRLKKPGEPTWADLKAMPRGNLDDDRPMDAEDIYAFSFFAPIFFDALPSGVDYAMHDLAVNSGVGGAIRALRRKWKMEPIKSGKMDAKLLWALKSRDSIKVIDDICDARLDLMMGAKNWTKFKDNWTRRVDKVRTRAKKMARKEPL